MSYEQRRMAAKLGQRQQHGEPQASSPLRQALDARASNQRKPDAGSAPPPVAPLAEANSGKPWAENFFRTAADADLPLATLNAIVATCDSYGEAMAKVSAQMPGGATAAPGATQGDAASRISAAHAKARGAREHAPPSEAASRIMAAHAKASPSRGTAR